ncbi:hypothetical protein AGABI2DRAFT_146848 [Agaricus bisporus var. bisporus H97]|uniref:hypothetical protein n=1 Tax=Agaricus bisporus var. bisporus (strain H97 / ATCC MYA-4626 / FGSC 10389) TaxID=936046 RepID=UPI00029F6390|nr:hypothetical protein AGABI2DRAFT_146848 [Agaricus bisporus var. bisporus H97]EKV41999.1 hypothetical protein AGABI2DRAFT_146848 [Agaricus bisporus var. bisporus H97]
MNNYTPSTLDKAVTLISHTTVMGILYTFSFILYCLCARLSFPWLRGRDGKRQTIFTFILTSVIIICATIDAAFENQYARIVYVDYSSLPGGPIGHLAQNHVSTILHILSLSGFIGGKLTLSVLLWRVWVVYSGTRCAIPIIILASIFYLANVVTDILQLVFTWPPQATELPNITRTLDLLIVMGLSVAETSEIMMTLMVITRLMLIRQKHIKLMGSRMSGKTDITAQYLGIAAMLIESYTLSTAWDIGFLIAYILKNPPAHNFFGRSVFQVEILSYFLILYRVFLGRAWDGQTQTKLSTLRWERRGTQPTDDNLDIEVVNNVEASTPIFSSRPNVYNKTGHGIKYFIPNSPGFLKNKVVVARFGRYYLNPTHHFAPLLILSSRSFRRLSILIVPSIIDTSIKDSFGLTSDAEFGLCVTRDAVTSRSQPLKLKASIPGQIQPKFNKLASRFQFNGLVNA